MSKFLTAQVASQCLATLRVRVLLPGREVIVAAALFPTEPVEMLTRSRLSAISRQQTLHGLSAFPDARPSVGWPPISSSDRDKYFVRDLWHIA
jgi:hypothetical protein